MKWFRKDGRHWFVTSVGYRVSLWAYGFGDYYISVNNVYNVVIRSIRISGNLNYAKLRAIESLIEVLDAEDEKYRKRSNEIIACKDKLSKRK